MILRTLLMVACLSAGRVAMAQTGSLRVQTDPPGADIEVNGQSQGTSPTTVELLPAGRHLLRVQKPGYHEIRRTVPLMAGQQVPLDLKLEEINGLLLVHSTPEGAELSIGGVFRGKTPLILPNLPLGTYRLQLSMPGYFPRDVEVALTDRTPKWVRETLQADAAALEVTSEPEGAAVTVNGASRGTTPVRIDRVNSGDAEVVVSLPGYGTYRETVKLAAGGQFSVKAILREQPGVLRVETVPPKARVYVDNQFRGDSPLVLDPVPAGDRRVRVELKGFETDVRTVRIRAGDQVTEEFKLSSNSGTLELVTEPPGVKVLVDGVDQGETKAQSAGLVSQSLRIESLTRGEHTLQLVRPGYEHTPRRFTVEPGKVITLTERLRKVFSPDTKLVMRDETGGQILLTGALLQRHPNGDIELATGPGVIRRIPAASIVDLQDIKAP